MTQPLRRLGVGLLLASATGCVYFNGVYNADVAARTGISRLAHDRDDEARDAFRRSAAAAESVLARHPASPWDGHARFLAGRGAALAGECEQGEHRLAEFLAQQDREERGGKGALRSPAAREEAQQWTQVALAACDVRQSRPAAARARVESLLARPRVATAPERQARLWGARAALAQGDLPAVPRYLGAVTSATLPWERLGVALNARAYAAVESLTVDRGHRGDFRDDALRAVRELASAGYLASAERAVLAYDRGGARQGPRAQLRLAVADAYFRMGRDSAADRHLRLVVASARRDSALMAEALARQGVIAVRLGASLARGDSLLAAMDSLTAATAVAQRFRDHWLLVRLLVARDAGTGTGRFLAAEVLRDSVRAPRLAAQLFAEVAGAPTAAALAPAAWYAAALLLPDSADEYRRRIRTEFGFSAVAARLSGEDPAQRPDFVSTPELLRFAWDETLRVYGDSVRRWRRARGPSRRGGA